jgi:hypothetical protein
LWNERRPRAAFRSSAQRFAAAAGYGARARDTRRRAALDDVGRPLATIRGLDLAPDKPIGSYLLMRDRRGRLFTLDRAARRVRRAYEYPNRPAGCRRTDALLFVCGRTIRDGSRVVARAPGRIGHWVWAERSPRGDAVPAQWSAECEVPVAYLIADGRLRAYGRESVALGFLPDGAALIHFPNGACAGTTQRRGIYTVPRNGKPRLQLRTPRFAQYLMWGG